MFDKKKKLTIEEKQVENEIILKSQLRNFRLYKEHIEPVFSKLIDLYKHICIFIFVINGTALLTIVNLNNPILNKSTPYLFLSLYFLFFYVLFLFCYIFLFLYFFKTKKIDYSFMLSMRGLLFGITFFTFLIVVIEFLLFIFGTGVYILEYYNSLSIK